MRRTAGATRRTAGAARCAVASTTRGLFMVFSALTLLSRLRSIPYQKEPIGERMENFPNPYIQPDQPETKHLGFGCAALHGTLERRALRPLAQRGKKDFLTIISLCLLLSGDIHPCPGPAPGITSPQQIYSRIEAYQTSAGQQTRNYVSSVLSLLHLPPPVFQLTVTARP